MFPSFCFPKLCAGCSPQLPVRLGEIRCGRKSGRKNFSCFLQLIEFRVPLSGIAIKVHTAARAGGSNFAATKCQTEPIFQELSPSPMTLGRLQAASCGPYPTGVLCICLTLFQNSAEQQPTFRMHFSSSSPVRPVATPLTHNLQPFIVNRKVLYLRLATFFPACA